MILTRIVRRAEAAGAITLEEGAAWLAHLDASCVLARFSRR